MIIHNLGTGQSFGTGRRDARLFGSATLPAFAFNPPTPPSAPMPTAAPTTQMGLLGADPSRARADAFLRSLGAMAPGLLMAGAPSTDPGQRGKGLAMAFGAQPQAYQQDLARTRAENVQKMNLQMAQAKAARAAQERVGLDQLAAQYNLPAGTSEAVIKSLIESQAKGRLDANQTVTQERAIRGELVKATGTAQDTVDAYKRMEAIFYNSAAKTPELFRIKDKDGNISAITIDQLGISGAADLALIFNFMKAQDPRSVVREGEFAMAANTGGFGEYIKSLISKVEDGQMLTNTQRANLMAQGRNQFIQADATIAKQLKRFGDLADRYKDKGISKENIVGGFVRYKPLLNAALKNFPKNTSNNVATVPEELAKKQPNTGAASKHELAVPSNQKFKLRHDPQNQSRNRTSASKPMITANGKVETVPVTQTSSPAPLTVSFDGQETDLKGKNTMADLQKLAAKIKSSSQNRVQLRAHAGGGDLSATQARRLSLSRALAIRSALIEMGVESTQIDVRALGSKTNDPNMNRVDINITRR